VSLARVFVDPVRIMLLSHRSHELPHPHVGNFFSCNSLFIMKRPFG